MWTWKKKKKRGKTHRFMAPCPVGTSSHWTSRWGVPSLLHGAAQAMCPEWLCPDGPSWAHCEFQDNSEKTAASERGDFYITGDWAHVDKDGYFWFMGRNNDVIDHSILSSSLLQLLLPQHSYRERQSNTRTRHFRYSGHSETFPSRTALSSAPT